MKKKDSNKVNSQQLKEYFLQYKDNQEAFHTYLDSKITKKKDIILNAKELDSLPQNLQIELLTQRLKDKFNL